jgi:hypothetical protein
MIGFQVFKGEEIHFYSAQEIIKKRFKSAADCDTPEKSLVLAIILQAVDDLFSAKKEEGFDPEIFLFGNEAGQIGEIVGLSGHWIRETILAVTESALNSPDITEV